MIIQWKTKWKDRLKIADERIITEKWTKEKADRKTNRHAGYRWKRKNDT